MRAWSAISAPTSSCATTTTYIFSIGPRVRWADNDYHDAYFGVPGDPGASGLAAPTIRAAASTRSARAAGLTHQARPQLGHAGLCSAMTGWSATPPIRPIVRDLGSRDQFSGGAGLFFEFTVGG